MDTPASTDRLPALPAHALVALCALLCLCGCGAPANAPSSEPGTTAGGDEAPATPATPVTVAAPSAVPQDLSGAWAQFWAPKGEADSPRYLLLADGRFGWLAARGAQGDGPRQMSGTWSRQGEALSLQVQQRRLVDGTVVAPEGEVITLQLGPCPANDEARAVDPNYACVSLDGQAHFRWPSQQVNETDFFQ